MDSMLERKHTTEHGIPEETGSCIDALSKHPGGSTAWNIHIHHRVDL